MDIYVRLYVGQSLSDYKVISDGIFVSKVTVLSLKDYCAARRPYCIVKHKKSCNVCHRLVLAGELILKSTICSLSLVFNPDIKYNSENAKVRILQLPVVALRIGSPKSGTSEIKVMEHMDGVDYAKLRTILSLNPKASCGKPKDEAQHILSFAQSRRELVYTIYKASGLTLTGTRRIYGFQNLSQRAKDVEEAERSKVQYVMVLLNPELILILN